MAEERIPKRLNIETDSFESINYDQTKKILDRISKSPGEAALNFSLHIKIGSGEQPQLTEADIERIRSLGNIPLRDILGGR